MANQLKMAAVNSIHLLKARGWSNRRIARELGIHRETVRRYVNLGACAPSDAQNRPNALTGSSGPQSRCEPYRDIIITKLDQGLTAMRIHQDLVAEHGGALSYYSVMRYCRRFRAARGLPFRRMECAPGGERRSGPRSMAKSGTAKGDQV